ncbi:MAG TPA: glutathione S-transferase family protein [Solirubrobacteraceae bacterium]|jgi:glutathione S-transferase|nr:glutathione S-transferase family protein [Solirubrobacteraceae bacterium]
MPIRLYTIPLSHPSLAARGMLERKGLDFEVVELLGGAHPAQLFAIGFRKPTVPAMKLADGERVQGSLAIAHALERVAPEPSLYPADPELRRAAEAAEKWGEGVLQPVPRRLIRWGLGHHLRQRQWFAREATPLPAAPLVGALLTPVVPIFVRQAKATDEAVRADLAALPGLLDEVDRLLGEGVIGGESLGAADYQIGSSLRMLSAFEDLGRMFAGRPADAFARRVVAQDPAVPAALPPDWLPKAA